MTVMIFLFLIVLIIVLRLVAGSLDRDRIENEIKLQGGKVISAGWSPFGKGWAGDKSDRIYTVIYLDKDGHTHEAFVKTSMWSGVYFSDDKIIEYADRSDLIVESPEEEHDHLKLENDRLKKEIESLKDQLDKRV